MVGTRSSQVCVTLWHLNFHSDCYCNVCTTITLAHTWCSRHKSNHKHAKHHLRPKIDFGDLARLIAGHWQALTTDEQFSYHKRASAAAAPASATAKEEDPSRQVSTTTVVVLDDGGVHDEPWRWTCEDEQEMEAAVDSVLWEVPAAHDDVAPGAQEKREEHEPAAPATQYWPLWNATPHTTPIAEYIRNRRYGATGVLLTTCRHTCLPCAASASASSADADEVAALGIRQDDPCRDFFIAALYGKVMEE